MNSLIEAALETIVDTVWCLSPSEKEEEGVRNLIKWQNGELSNHDDSMIGSDKSYILLATREGLFLVHRKKKWKGKLDAVAENLYEKRGNRAFRRIHKHLLRTPV